MKTVYVSRREQGLVLWWRPTTRLQCEEKDPNFPFGLHALLLTGVLAQTSTPKRPATSAQHRSAPPKRPAPAVPEDDKKAIQELHDRDIKASMEFDVEALADIWTQDIVSMPPGQPPVVGKEANRALLLKSQAEMAKMEILGYNEEWQEVQLLGENAVEWGTISGRLRPM